MRLSTLATQRRLLVAQAEMQRLRLRVDAHALRQAAVPAAPATFNRLLKGVSLALWVWRGWSAWRAGRGRAH
jgi:hypothetical protein